MSEKTYDETSTHPSGMGGTQRLVFYDNGYGASIIESEWCYGGRELAVILGNEDKFSLAYDTGITNDVLGYLSIDEVADLLVRIRALK